MIGRDPTGSKMHRVLRCPASAALPQIDDLEPRPPAVRGTKIHRFLQRVSELKRDGMTLDLARAAALRELAADKLVTPDVYAYLEILDVEAMPVDLAAEVAIAYDWSARTARELGRGGGRDYTGIKLTEIAFTTDVLGVGEDRVYVGDYKSGHAWIPPPADNGQMLTMGLGAAKLHGKDEAELELLLPDEDGQPRRVTAIVGVFELDAFADDVERAMSDVATAKAIVGRGGTPNVVTGEHCRYCPAFRACPAQQGLVRAALSGPPVRTGGILAPGALEPARLAATWRTLKEVRLALGQLEGEILTLAGREPIDLGEGKVLGPVETAREKVTDADAAHRVLESRYSREAADSAMKRTTSKVAIRKAVTRYKPDKTKISTSKGDGELDRVLDSIRATGGIKVSRSVRVKETTPDRLAPPIAAPVGSLPPADSEEEDSDDFG